MTFWSEIQEAHLLGFTCSDHQSCGEGRRRGKSEENKRCLAEKRLNIAKGGSEQDGLNVKCAAGENAKLRTGGKCGKVTIKEWHRNPTLPTSCAPWTNSITSAFSPRSGMCGMSSGQIGQTTDIYRAAVLVVAFWQTGE